MRCKYSYASRSLNRNSPTKIAPRVLSRCRVNSGNGSDCNGMVKPGGIPEVVPLPIALFMIVCFKERIRYGVSVVLSAEFA